MNYEDAILALKNAQIHKEFPNENSFDKFVKQIKKMENSEGKMNGREEFRRRIAKREIDMQDDEERIFYVKMFTCLSELANQDQEKMYELIQSFDTHKKAFIKPNTF